MKFRQRLRDFAPLKRWVGKPPSDISITGHWKIKYYRGDPEIDPGMMIGQVLQMDPAGLLSVVSNGRAYFGQWRLADNGKMLEMKLQGNWLTFLISNRWDVYDLKNEVIKLFQVCDDYIQELHLAKA